MRLVDADALLKDINDYPYGYRGMIKDTIAKQPTVEPKQGRWINANEGLWNTVEVLKCSVCGGARANESDEWLDICRQEWNYCPVCGRFIGDEVDDGKID